MKNKSKFIITRVGNWDKEENQISLRIKNINDKAIIANLDRFFLDLRICSYFSDPAQSNSPPRYKDYIGKSVYLSNNKYRIHVIFSEKYLFLIIKTAPANRKEMLKKLMKYSKWAKAKK